MCRWQLSPPNRRDVTRYFLSIQPYNPISPSISHPTQHIMFTLPNNIPFLPNRVPLFTREFIYRVFYRPSLILTQSANIGKAPRKLGPRDQLFKSRRWLSNAGLISHWSSSFGRGPLSPPPSALGVPGADCSVAAPVGDPALTCIEYAEAADIDDVTDIVWV